jgi:hypothetical protein
LNEYGSDIAVCREVFSTIHLLKFCKIHVKRRVSDFSGHGAFSVTRPEPHCFQGLEHRKKTTDGIACRNIGFPICPPTLQFARWIEKQRIGFYTEKRGMFNLI